RRRRTTRGGCALSYESFMRLSCHPHFSIQLPVVALATRRPETPQMPARPLIPRRKLFGNPTFLDLKLSPDGPLLSWIAAVDGVMNVWVAPVDDIGAASPVTRTKGRPITWQDWSPDGRHLMFVNDENGDENLHLFVADPRTCELRDLTPYPNVRALPVQWSPLVPDRIAVSLNDRDVRWPDVFALDLASGGRSLCWANRQEFVSVGLDWQLNPRHARSTLPDGGGARLWRIDDGQVSLWRDVPFEAHWSTWALAFDATGRYLYQF